MSTLTITSNIYAGNYVVEGYVTSTGDIPDDIFMYENTGAGLGAYQGVCSLADYKRMQTYAGTPIPVFGNKFIKHNRANLIFDLTHSLVTIKTNLTDDVKAFKIEYQAEQTTSTTTPL